MSIFCFNDNLNCEVEGLILQNLPEIYRRYCKGHPLTFTAGPFSIVCVFLALPYIVLWLIFTNWTGIWLSWQPDLCDRQKSGSEGQRWSATGEPLYCMKASVFPCCQCIIVVRWKPQNSPSFSCRPHRGHKCVNVWIPKDDTAANREIRASRNAPCVFPPCPPLSVYTVWFKGLL